MNEKGEITLLTSENITPYFMFDKKIKMRK
jgi:hypothetical protein